MGSKRSTRKSKALKSVIITLLIIILACVSAFAAYGYFISKKMNDKNIAPKQVDIKTPANILVLGVDAANKEDKTSQSPRRSDTMMLIRFNPITNKAYILSLPRDTKVKLNGRTEKLNAAHAIGGPEKTIEVIEEMLDIKINYYVKVDYEGFKKCIDAVGGVDVVVPQNMDYDAGDISIHFKKGENVHLDGQEAERFVRWRKNNDGGGYARGDIGRQGTQQEFILKVFEKLKTPQGIIRVPGLINTLSGYASTNMQYTTMLQYATKISSLNSANIDKKILPGESKYIDGISYYIWDKEKSEDYIANFRSVNSDSQSTYSDKNVEKNKMKVVVLNSTGKSGLAAEYKNRLESMGYNVVKTGNYAKRLRKTAIEDYSESDYGEVVKSDINIGIVKSKSNNNEYNASIIIILGNDSME